MNSNSEKLKIHVIIGGMRIPLKIRRQDEEIYRNAEKLVKAFLKDYRKKYSRRSNEELLTLAAYRAAVLLAEHDFNANISDKNQEISSLNEELEHLLNSDLN
jgi:cell division protein ZapA